MFGRCQQEEQHNGIRKLSLFSLHERLNNVAFRLFNVASDLHFSAQFKTRRLVDKNKRFAGKHLGQRCFVVATGPSILRVPSSSLGALSVETVFAVNSFYKSDALKHINPKYYCLMDNLYWGNSRGAFNEIANRYNGCLPTFITDVRATPFVPLAAECIALYSKNFPVDRMRCDLSGNLSIAMNVVGFSIVSAIYMGFTEIYLLGCDYNLFCQRQGNHCYDDSGEFASARTYNLAFYLKYYHMTTEFHYRIAELSRKRGVKIVNLTEQSLLDAYPIGSLETVLNAATDEK